MTSHVGPPSAYQNADERTASRHEGSTRSITRDDHAFPRISVIVPVYNSARYLREAIKSALAQQPPPWEVIVRDGGSTDGSIDILREFGDAVWWESGPDRGQAHALNMAASRVTGDVVVWLNADDVLLPGAFATVQEAFRTRPALAFVYGNYDMIRPDGEIMRRFRSSAFDPCRVFTHGCYIFSGALFLTRDVLTRIGPFDETLHACMDLDFLLRLGDAPWAQVERTVAQFRRSPSAKSSRMRWSFLREGHRVRQRAAGASARLRLIGMLVDIRDLILLTTEPIRYTRAWSMLRRSKTL